MDKPTLADLEEIATMVHRAKDIYAYRSHIDALIRRTAATANQREDLISWHVATSALVKELIRLQSDRLESALTLEQVRFPVGEA